MSNLKAKLFSFPFRKKQLVDKKAKLFDTKSITFRQDCEKLNNENESLSIDGDQIILLSTLSFYRTNKNFMNDGCNAIVNS